jgi:hypothetical protein
MRNVDVKNVYRRTKDWRRKNPEKYNVLKKKNYSSTRKNARNRKQAWDLSDITTIMAPDRPCDRELSKLIGRSVQAIQVMRSRITKNKSPQV